MSEKNKKSEIREGSTFASYEPKTPEQEEALALAQYISTGLAQGNNGFTTSSRTTLSSPFGHGYFYLLSGKPGVGKTHLMEAIVNDLKVNAPNVYNALTFQKGNLPYASVLGIADHEVDWKPIVFLDDVWANKPNIAALTSQDINNIMALIQFVYDRKIFCVMTCNFPFVDEILPLITLADPVGRVVSRAAELITGRSQEIVIQGPDHRMEMARNFEAAKSGGAGFFLPSKKGSPTPTPSG